MNYADIRAEKSQLQRNLMGTDRTWDEAAASELGRELRHGSLGHFRTVSIWFPGSLWNSNALHLYIWTVLLQWDIVSFSQTALHSSLNWEGGLAFLTQGGLSSNHSRSDSAARYPVEASDGFWNVPHHMHGFLWSNKSLTHAGCIPISLVVLRQDLTV